MRFEIRERDRRALVALVIAAALYFVLSYVVFPSFDRLALSSENAAAKEEELIRYRRAFVRKGHYSKLLEQARKNSVEAEGRLIRGDNPSLASVELQTIVEEAAKKLELELGPRNMSTARKKDDYFNELTMAISFECTPNQLVMFLNEIRLAPKFITIRSAETTPLRVVHEAPKDEDFIKAVRVKLTLAAVLSSAPAAPKG